MPAPGPNWFLGLRLERAPWLPGLLATAPEGLRRFHRDDLHATVAFLGPCGEGAARRAWAAAEGLDFAGFEGLLRGLVPMGNPRRPSAFALLVDSPPLKAWMGRVRGPLGEAAGAQPEQRPPKPHVTVARPGFRARPPLIEAGTAWAAATPPLDEPVAFARLALFTRAQDRGERLFRVVAERGA